MTRSVEIPEDERERVAGVLHGFEHDRLRSRCPGSDECELWQYAVIRVGMVLAALPYLAPAADSFEVHAIQPHGDVIYQVRRVSVDVVGEFPTYEQARDHAEVWEANSNG